MCGRGVSPFRGVRPCLGLRVDGAGTVAFLRTIISGLAAGASSPEQVPRAASPCGKGGWQRSGPGPPDHDASQWLCTGRLAVPTTV